MSIQHWPEEDRPREKLLQHGPQALSDAELLAIFLRVGVKGMSAVALSEHMLTHFGGLSPLSQASLDEFCAIKGLGTAKYVQWQACLEMAKRVVNHQLSTDIMDEAALRYKIHLQLKHQQEEELWIYGLSAQHAYLGQRLLSAGDMQRVQLSKKPLAQMVLDMSADVVVLAHNHPQGSHTPSQQDILYTQHAQALLHMLDVTLLDHVIVGHTGLFSMREHGYI